MIWCAQPFALKSLYLDCGDPSTKKAVYPSTFQDAVPARLTSDIAHWVKRPLDASRARLTSGHPQRSIGDDWLSAYGESNPYRINSAKAVDYPQAERHSIRQPAFLDSWMLEPINLRCVGDEKRRTDFTFICEHVRQNVIQLIEQQLPHLSGLLFERYPGAEEQQTHFPLVKPPHRDGRRGVLRR